jgi:hypothetical protein
MSTARDWFSAHADFCQLCGDAVSQAKGENAQDFAHEMIKAANVYGLEASLTERQLRWLCTLADWEVPQRLSPQPQSLSLPTAVGEYTTVANPNAGAITFSTPGYPGVVKIESDGRILWRGREVESDADFRSAMIEVRDLLRRATGWRHTL